MVTSDGVVKIVDFGIAKVVDQTGATRTGVTLGTVTYMSPEQLDGEPIDGRSDLWSLGATMYEMLAGKPPFEGDSVLVLMKAIGTRDATPIASRRPDVPASLAAIVARAMRRERNDRFASAVELVHQLTECRNEQTGAAAARRASSRAFTRPRLAAAAVVVAAAIAGGVGWSMSRGAKLRAARERIPEITRLVDQDRYADAFRVALEIEPLLADDPTLRELWPRFSRTLPITSTPEGARVSTAIYTEKKPIWRELGVTPLSSVRVPVGLQRFRFARDGKPLIEIAVAVGNPLLTALNPSLDGVEDGEVAVIGGGVNSWIRRSGSSLMMTMGCRIIATSWRARRWRGWIGTSVRRSSGVT